MPVTSLEQQQLDRLRYLQKLQSDAAKIRKTVIQYYNDPIAFAADCFYWPDTHLGEPGGLKSYQQEIISTLHDEGRCAVRGPHGLGKSAIAAVTVLWFALTRDAAGTDWKCVTTAGAWRQLINYLWPEIRKFAGRIKWDKVRESPFNGRELLNLNLRLKHGAAMAAACSNPALIEGAHADSLLFVYDESKAIPAGTFDACEGAFSGTGETFVLALSTPGPPQGRFYDIHVHKPGYEDWKTKHVTLSEAIAAGQIKRDWADQRKKQWGEKSALYLNRVLGEFHAGEEDSVIPLSWVEAAIERWYEWEEAGMPDLGDPHTIGVDVARSGEDKTVMAVRWGPVIKELRTSTHESTMATAGRVKGMLDADESATAIVDVIGIGAGVVDRLREQNARVQPFTASGKTNRKDSTGELHFLNVRAASWYNLRELLDPSAGSTICLPDDDDMLGDLTAPKLEEPLSGGKLKIEKKADIKKRIGRSTDRGDAVVQAFWTQSGNWMDAYGVMKCAHCNRGFLGIVNGKLRTHCPFCQKPIEIPVEDGDGDDEE